MKKQSWLAIVFLLSLSTTKSNAGRNAGDDFAKYFDVPQNSSQSLNLLDNKIDWSQPPLGFVEEMVPSIPEIPCLDLSTVKNPFKDWPSNIGEQEKKTWYSRRRQLSYCRAIEIQRREHLSPGSMDPVQVELAWMIENSVQQADKKVAAVYEANQKYGMPAHVLVGAIQQESLFSELGISDDGGNFSCGPAQINILGWCQWAIKQSPADKTAMQWPSQITSCSNPDLFNLNYIRPFYNIAIARLNGAPLHRLSKEHFKNISLDDVRESWQKISEPTLQLRYQIIRSFIDSCSDPRRSILAAANEFTNTYNAYVPAAFKQRDRYGAGDSFARTCKKPLKGNAYPLHAGWLMAVAAYNAGPRAIEAVAHYNRWNKAEFNDPVLTKDLTPDLLIPSLYWAGKYNSINDKIEFASPDNKYRSWIWYKGCVVQRHVARVMQHVTLVPEFFVDTLKMAS
jgi:hypothetical protein